MGTGNQTEQDARNVTITDSDFEGNIVNGAGGAIGNQWSITFVSGKERVEGWLKRAWRVACG